VVLATGQVPNAGVNLDEWTATVTAAEKRRRGGQKKKAPAPDLGAEAGLPPGPGPAAVQVRLADSHFICFPYETRRTGIYAAGPTRRPMDMLQATEDATGAALKAIQAVENAARAAPRIRAPGDLSYPIVRLEGCTQCKRCTVECPFGAIDEDEKRFPKFNEALPALRHLHGRLPGARDLLRELLGGHRGQQIKAVDMPDEFEEKPRILILACENDAYPALDMAGIQRTVYSAFVRAIPVRCLGSVNTIWITDALNGGWDGVMMMGCKKGDDYQCHFVKGSEMAHYRMSKIDDTLKQLGLEPERVIRRTRWRSPTRARGEADQRLRRADQGNRHVADEGLRLKERMTMTTNANQHRHRRYKNNFLRKSRPTSRAARW
jgi:quinone-modifying oxidoreductase subunit QmoB